MMKESFKDIIIKKIMIHGLVVFKVQL